MDDDASLIYYSTHIQRMSSWRYFYLRGKCRFYVATTQVGDGGTEFYNLFGAFLLPHFHDGPHC